MAAPIKTGAVFGDLKVLRLDSHEEYGNRVYRCRCVCGQVVTVEDSNLRSGRTSSCGCKKKRSLFSRWDLTGQRFGRLIAIEIVAKQGRKNVWECQCDCGNLHRATTDMLRNGFVKSCGCLRRREEVEEQSA